MTNKIHITTQHQSKAYKIPKNWFKPAHVLWQQGQKPEAIKSVIAEVNRLKDTPVIELFVQAGFYLYFIGDYRGTVSLLTQAVKIAPEHLESRQNLIVALNKSGDYHASIEHSEYLLRQQPNNYTVYDTLTVSYACIGELDKAKQAGSQSLTLKDQQVLQRMRAASSELTQAMEPSQKPQAFLQSSVEKKHDVIAFSLFGQHQRGQAHQLTCHPRYLYGAIRNLSLMGDIYPDWEAWIYLDDSVPKQYQQLFEDMGAVLKPQPNGQGIREKLCWRFQVANEANVGRFLVRDIDSVIGVREQLAVQKWLTSDKYFHIMRDWWSHTDLMLAGMWGGVAGVLPNLSDLLSSYTNQSLETPNIDQWFLRDCVWQYVCQSVCIHDRYFTPDFVTSSPLSDRQNIALDNPWRELEQRAERVCQGKSDPLHIGGCEWHLRNDYQRQMVQPWLAIIGEKVVNVKRS